MIPSETRSAQVAKACYPRWASRKCSVGGSYDSYDSYGPLSSVQFTRPGQRLHVANWNITMLLKGKSTISTGAIFKFANCLFTRGY